MAEEPRPPGQAGTPPPPAPAAAPRPAVMAAPRPTPSAAPPGETPTAPMTGHAATDTAADAADAEGRIRATRRMPEPDSLGG